MNLNLILNQTLNNTIPQITIKKFKYIGNYVSNSNQYVSVYDYKGYAIFLTLNQTSNNISYEIYTHARPPKGMNKLPKNGGINFSFVFYQNNSVVLKLKELYVNGLSPYSSYNLYSKTGNHIILKNNPCKKTYISLWKDLVSFGVSYFGDSFDVLIKDWAHKILKSGNKVNMAQFMQLTGKNTFYYPERFCVEHNNNNSNNSRKLINTYEKVLKYARNQNVNSNFLNTLTENQRANLNKYKNKKIFTAYSQLEQNGQMSKNLHNKFYKFILEKIGSNLKLKNLNHNEILRFNHSNFRLNYNKFKRNSRTMLN